MPSLLQTSFLGLLSTSVAAFQLLPVTSHNRHRTSTHIRAVTENDTTFISVALTREDGKNGKIQEGIQNHPSKELLKDSLKLNLVEMPCVAHAVGPDVASFTELLDDNDGDLTKAFDYIVITSPESAKVFANLVDPSSSSSSLPKIAAVGKATKKALTNLDIPVFFTPTKANGKALSEELPPVDKVKLTKVLYPASAQADNTIQDNLEGRKDCSFSVTRLNTYDTVPVQFSDEQKATMMNDVDIACFGSPSSVKAWIQNVDEALGNTELDEEEKKKADGSNGNVVAVCIGSTTAKECLNSGRWHANDIYYPKISPGMEGWVDSCFSAAGDVMERSFWGGGW